MHTPTVAKSDEKQIYSRGCEGGTLLERKGRVSVECADLMGRASQPWSAGAFKVKKEYPENCDERCVVGEYFVGVGVGLTLEMQSRIWVIRGEMRGGMFHVLGMAGGVGLFP